MVDPPEVASVPDRILDAAENVLRRHGVEKTNVVDVARALDMSHGNIYRYFPSKTALLDAVAKRWLDKMTLPLAAIAADSSRPAGDRLRKWFDTLRAAKLKKIRKDPELFRVYHKYVQSMRQMTDAHLATLHSQLECILADGINAGEFRQDLKPAAAAKAFIHATSRFHHPALVMLDPPPLDADAKALMSLLLAGLRSTAA